MQYKTTVRCYLKPTRMALIKKKENNMYRQGCGEMGMLILRELTWKVIQTLGKKLVISKVVKHKFTMCPNNSLWY